MRCAGQGVIDGVECEHLAFRNPASTRFPRPTDTANHWRKAMTRTNKKILRLSLAPAGFVVLFGADKMAPQHPDALVATADARIGRPLTPMSYAGVARRTVRRGAYVAGAAAAAGAAGAYYRSGCYQAADAYGRLHTVCP
jgi:hypothetical protein